MKALIRQLHFWKAVFAALSLAPALGFDFPSTRENMSMMHQRKRPCMLL